MKIPRCLDKIVKIATLGSALLFNPVQAHSDIYLYGNIGIDLRAETPNAQVETVPEYIRDVPAHSGDSSLHIAPINDSPLTLFPYSLTLEGRAGIGFEGKGFDIRIGPTAGLVLAGNFCPPIERNYTNHPGTSERGEGAALTFYNIEQDGFAFIPGVSARISVPLNDQFTGFAEYSADFLHQFFIKNGWDRYDKFETKDTYKLADSIKHTIKLGVEVPMNDSTKTQAFVGVTIPQIVGKTSLADETKFKVSPSVIFGVKFELEANTK